ncbi:MAG: hypothetical protein WDZ85_03560 [Candidatus Paceibacterota bacterium]
MMTKALHFNNLEIKLFWLSLFLIGALIFSYIYLVNSSMINVARREQLEEEISLRRNDITNLVADYMTNRSAIGFNEALALGFADAAGRNTFAVRGEKSVTLTLGGDDR